MNFQKSVVLIFLVLFIDQATKLYIKTHFILGDYVDVFDWFKIYFVENNGMAFGAEWGGKTGKILLTLFRLLAIGGIFYWLKTSIDKKQSKVLIVSISLIFAGALGNIIDSVFYGTIFTSSVHQVAQLLPEQGYAPLLQGKVVDMLYFPIFDIDLPDYLPLIGGKHFTFFEPVFNVADSAITIGVTLMILFNKRIFSDKKEKENFHQEIEKMIDDTSRGIA